MAGPIRPDLLVDRLTTGVPPEARPIAGGSPVTTLVRELHDRGHHLHVSTLVYGLDETVSLTGDRLRVDLCPNRDAGRARDAFAAERTALRDSLRASGADLVHAQWTYEFALAAQETGLPVVVTARDWAPAVLRYLPDPYRLVRLAMAKVALRRARIVTVTSPYMRRKVRRWTSGTVQLIPNAVPDSVFTDVATAVTRPAAPLRLVAVNNGWGPLKNISTLLEAHAHLRQRHPDAELRLVGHGYAHGGQAASWAAERGLTAGVTFVGPLAHHAALEEVAAATVFVHPSREESFGLVLVEAMAKAVPVVAGQHSGAVPWVCEHGRAGALTDIEDPAAIAAAIVLVGRDGAPRERVVRRGYERAWDRFRMSVIVDAYLRMYEEALDA